MTQYIAFENPDGTQTLVEVSEKEVARAPGQPVKAGLADKVGDFVKVATTSFQDAIAGAIHTNAQALQQGIQQISPPPTEVEIQFALKATGEMGNVAVGKVGGDTNYSVKLMWKPAPVKSTDA